MSPLALAPAVESLYPVFLKLAGRRVVLVGGGPMAASKLAGLMETGASVSVVAPEIVPQIRRSGRHPDRAGVRASRPGWGMARGRRGATRGQPQRALRRGGEGHLRQRGRRSGSASAYLGGVLRRSGVTIAVSTQGHAPALAGLLREALEAIVPEEIGAWVAEARALRDRQKSTGVPLPPGGLRCCEP
jgi:uroporphyrin-III C-methyltransferase/precorrin-2 dehydrogenase/sirohydrochlorin ferrochelatase